MLELHITVNCTYSVLP